MRSLDPTAKFFSLLVLTFVAASRHDPVFNTVLFLLCFLLMIGSRVKFKTLGIILIPIILGALGMFFTGYHFAQGDSMPVRDSLVAISGSNFYNGYVLASRVLAYSGVGFVFALTTDRIQMVRSLRSHLHIPQIFAYGLLAAWGIFPRMGLEYRRARAAFRARGIRVTPVSPALLKPLLVKSIRWSEALATAMESKGFAGDAQRTEFEPPRFHGRDWSFLALCCVAVPLWSIFF